LEVLAAVIEAAPLLVANNTGPVHVAAAVGTPVVDLYALTNPQHTPWEVPSRVLYADVPCRMCYKSVCPHGHQRCLADVPAAAVADAACELLEEIPPSPEGAAHGGAVDAERLRAPMP
jgi:ADP-heptose:LPS heptosyltransferase